MIYTKGLWQLNVLVSLEVKYVLSHQEITFTLHTRRTYNYKSKTMRKYFVLFICSVCENQKTFHFAGEATKPFTYLLSMHNLDRAY